MNRFLVGLLFLASLSACSTAHYSTSHVVCKKWQNDGLILATLPSCIACVEQLGSGNPQAIQGCALGMDANGFLSSGN